MKILCGILYFIMMVIVGTFCAVDIADGHYALAALMGFVAVLNAISLKGLYD